MVQTALPASADVVLIGAGIMSATLGSMLKELEPSLNIVMLEVLDDCAQESSQAWNNAGTGHAANCELNYTPQAADGSVDISRALEVNTEFDLSRQLWSYLVKKGAIADPRAFLHPCPHMSFVWGKPNVEFLQARYKAMSAHHCYYGMEYSEDRQKITDWAPLITDGRDQDQPIAATRIITGADVDYGALTHLLVAHLSAQSGFSVHYKQLVVGLEREASGRWGVEIDDVETRKRHAISAKFVFIGAGGGALPLLQKSRIPEAHGYGGFPVSGIWLRCDTSTVSERHHAKVYGKASEGSPPMSVPHLDTRIIGGVKSLLFGPYAGFSTRFLKHGSLSDLPRSIEPGNILPMLAVARDDAALSEYLIGQVLQTSAHQFAMLQQFFPTAHRHDWKDAVAGQRVQIIKPDNERTGVLEFGTELLAAEDRSLVALLGASPGASTAAFIALGVLQKCFAGELTESAWLPRLQQIIPTYGIDLKQDGDACRRIRAQTAATLQLDNVEQRAAHAGVHMAKTVAELITDVLRATGVKRIYGVVGDSLNGVTESLRRHGDIDWVHVRNEEVAAFAAGAEAALTGELAVCAGSCGPGNLHLINGLYDCQRSRVPVLAIAAHIPSAEIGRGYFQETKPDNLFRDCSHFCELVSHPAQLPGVLESAIRAAIGYRGVAVVVIPGDIALEDFSAAHSAPAALAIQQPLVVPGEQQLAALAALLNAGTRTTLLCGRGCAGAHDQLIKLAAVLKSPIVHALGGKEHVEWDNPYDVGMTGLIGFSSGYKAMLDCDTLLMLGTDFPYRQFYPSHAKIAQVDLRPENLGRRTRLDLGIIGDVGATIAALLPKLKPRQDDAHLNDSVANYRHARHGLDELAAGTSGRKPIHPQHLTRLLSEHANEDAVFTFDVGTCTVWAARYLKMNGRRRMIGSLMHGSMANAMPQAIGAQAAYPGRQVISLSGDGGFTMLMGDIITLVQCKLPVKVVVFNNGTLGFVALEMKASGFLETGTDLQNPDFGAMARAIGIHGRRVDDPNDLEAAVTEFLAHDGPALLDVVTNKQELAMPPTITPAEVKGFGLWALHAVMNARGDELIDLAKSNLLR